MATFHESTSQGNPSDRNPSPFPSFGNVDSPYMATLCLPGLTIGLLVWYLSTSVVPSVQNDFQSSSPPPEQHQPYVDPKVTPHILHLFFHLRSSSSPSESLDSSNQEAKKKKKRTKNKKKNKQGGNQEAIAMNLSNQEKSSNQPWKVKFACMLCKGDHVLQSCHSIPKVLEVWSTGSHKPLSLASGDHVGDKPSTSNSKAHRKKGKVKFPCKLCEGNHPIHLYLLMDEASKELENLTASQPHFPDGYRKLSPNPSLVDAVIDQKSYLVNPSL